MISRVLMVILLFGFGRVYCQDDPGMSDTYDSMITEAENKASDDGKKVLETGRTMTLVNKEILPGSCWDYANAVYDRAGYGWGKREDIFKGVKTGPYAEVSRIKSGDWLYYVNHSYGDIEHSAIFVDWIDYDRKLALMLSYGGESRHEPARYMPYELNNVYGITRANAGLAAAKAVTTIKVSSAASSSAANQSAANTSSSHTIASTPSEPVSGGTVNGMKIESLKFGTGVANMEIAGESVSFSGTADKVYCWMRVTGGQGKTLKVKWYLNGNPIGETALEIKSNAMRTYAYRTVTGRKGDWKIEIVDPSGALLHSAGFTVN